MLQREPIARLPQQHAPERRHRHFCDDYAFTFVFVDDGSTDDTWTMLQELFGSRPDCRLVRHEHNQGVARTIQTGIRHADTHDRLLDRLRLHLRPARAGSDDPLLTEDVDLVTASPVPPCRPCEKCPELAALSFQEPFAALSYGAPPEALHLHQLLPGLSQAERGRPRAPAPRIPRSRRAPCPADLAGHRVVEYPTTLDVRVLGRSKMKIFWTITGHLALLAVLAPAAAQPARRGNRAGSPVVTPPPRVSASWGGACSG